MNESDNKSKYILSVNEFLSFDSSVQLNKIKEIISDLMGENVEISSSELNIVLNVVHNIKNNKAKLYKKVIVRKDDDNLIFELKKHHFILILLLLLFLVGLLFFLLPLPSISVPKVNILDEEVSYILPTLTKTGYTFLGWYDEDGNFIGNGGDTYTPSDNVTLVDCWQAHEYTITYNGNGATSGSMELSNHVYDDATSLPLNNFKREYVITYEYNNGSADTIETISYAFKGWSTSITSKTYYSDGTSILNLSSEDGDNVNLYANWSSNSTTLPSPTRVGYSFQGWYDSDGNFIGNGGDSYTPTENITLEAKWKANTYSVSYKSNGATSGSTTTSTHTYDEASSITSNSYVREYTITYMYNNGTSNSKEVISYTFLGWVTEPDSSVYLADGTSILNLTDSTETVTLYASWSSNSTTLPTPTKTGYTFLGWYDENGNFIGNGGDSYTPTEDITIVAKWQANTYTIIYHGNSNTSGETETSSHTFDVSQNLTPNEYIREYIITYQYDNGSADTIETISYTFNGWSTTIDGDVVYSDENEVLNLSSINEDNIDLYASWSSNSTTLPSPTKIGYTFLGWYDENGNFIGNGGDSYTPSDNITLVAKWQANTYTITYNGNEETSGSTTTSTHTYDVSSSLTSNGYLREYTITYEYNNDDSNSSETIAYTFNGWSTTINGEVIYSNKVEVLNLTSIEGDNIDLYASWSSNSTMLPTPTRVGYSFQGWYDSDGNYIGFGGSSYTPTKDITLVAYWTAHEYRIYYDGNNSTTGSMNFTIHTYDEESMLSSNKYIREYVITYEYNNGEANSSETIAYTFNGWSFSTDNNAIYLDDEYVLNLSSDNNGVVTLYAAWGSSSTTLPTPTRTGYTFIGWYDEDDNFIGNGGDSYTPTEDITIVAKWQANTYTITYNGNEETSGSTATSTHTYDVSSSLTSNGYIREYIITYQYDNGSADTIETISYAFNGWSTTIDGDVVYSDGNEVLNLSSINGDNIDLYANWSSNSTTLPSPTKIGYTFLGWYDEDGNYIGAGGDTYTPTEDITLEAKWQANTYTVTYNGNGATSGSMESSIHTYDEYSNLSSNEYNLIYIVTYEYNNGDVNSYGTSIYSFVGWSTSSTGSVVYSNKQAILNLTSVDGDNIDLYAMWSGTSIKLPVPTKTGYTFLGWYDENGNFIGNGGDSYTPIDDITIVAKWQANTYTITYNGNGATSGSTATSTHTYDTSQSLTSNGFVRKYTIIYDVDSTCSSTTVSYAFTGWSTSSTGSVIYSNAESVINLAENLGDNINLYAIWNSNSTTLPTPTKTGYTFLGWYDENGNFIGNGGDSYTPTEDITLYAKWKINQYYVDVNSIVEGTTYSSGKSGFTFNVYINGTLKASNVTDFSGYYDYGTVVRVVANTVSGYAQENEDVTKTLGTSSSTFTPTWFKYTSIDLATYQYMQDGGEDTTVSYTFDSSSGVYTITQKGGTTGWGNGAIGDNTKIYTSWGQTYVLHFMIYLPDDYTLRIDANAMPDITDGSGGNDSYGTYEVVIDGVSYGSVKDVELSGNKWYTVDFYVSNNSSTNNPYLYNLRNYSTWGLLLTSVSSSTNISYYIKDLYSYIK